jgi:transposase, IS5 family
MRKKSKKQLPLMPAASDHPQAVELENISRILDANPTICDLAMQDLSEVSKKAHRSGARGMTADQVVRAAIVKQMFGFAYKELAFHIIDSNSIRRFMRIGIADKGFKKSVLNKNVKALSPQTWEAINEQLVHYANDEKIEKGREVRIDCTVVESNIHDPKDSNLLWDSVRVLTRLLHRAKEDFGLHAAFQDHSRRAKRRLLGIMNSRSKKDRKKKYADLIKVTNKSIGYAHRAIEAIDQVASISHGLVALRLDLNQYSQLAARVVDQTQRRVMLGEDVPASDKVVSLFETHTDIIVKDRRDTYFGHKVCLTGGASNLIVDCLIVDGNPADSSLTIDMLDRQKELYGRYPLKVALDGGFASKENLNKAKEKQIKDVCFAKKRGLEVDDMCRSQWVYNRLRRFRAGIESGVSWIKRCFGMTRCTWKGLRSFKSYVWASIVSANLLTLARKQAA